MKDWLIQNASYLVSNALFTAALGCVAVGFWLAWEPLGLIVPGMFVLGVGVLSRLRGASGD